MTNVQLSQNISPEEYFIYEEGCEVKNEFYKGKLFPMSGAPILHNQMCLKLYMHFYALLHSMHFQIFVENVKVKIENESIFLYPDLIVTREQFHSMNDYFVHEPLLLVEVLSDRTRKYDTTDKFIQYQKISSLQYYLSVEPEKQVIIVNEKDASGEWTAKIFTELTEEINLPVLEARFTLADIYKA